MIRRGLLGILVAAAWAVPAIAHHGIGSFDLSKQVTFTGKLTRQMTDEVFTRARALL